MLLMTIASAVVLVQQVALLKQFLKAKVNTLSMQRSASTVELVLMFAPWVHLRLSNPKSVFLTESSRCLSQQGTVFLVPCFFSS